MYRALMKFKNTAIHSASPSHPSITSTDLVGILPIDVWNEIFKLLTQETLLDVMFLHPSFYELGQPIFFRDLALFSTKKKDVLKMQRVLIEPTSAIFVKTVIISEPQDPTPPSKKRRGAGKVLTRLSHQTPPTFMEIDVIPRLTNVENLQVRFLYNPLRHSNFGQYLSFWASIGSNWQNIRSFQLSLDYAQIPFFAQCMTKASSAFELLEEFSLNIELPSPRAEKADLDVISLIPYFASLRKSIRRLSFSTGGSPVNSPMFPLSCLGHFPCIVQVNQGYTGSNWEEEDSFASHKFLSLHHETLQCLILKMLDPPCFPYLWFTPSSDPLPKLSTIHLELKNSGVHGRSAWQTLDTLPKFTPFIDTLTTLSLVGPFLYYDDLERLLQELARETSSGPKAIIRRFRFDALYFSPDMIDLLHRYLDQVEVLDISYMWLVRYKDERVSVSGASYEVWNIMRRKKYPRWGLSSLDIRCCYHDQARDKEFLHLMKSAIPSLKKIGQIDWSDVDGERCIA